MRTLYITLISVLIGFFMSVEPAKQEKYIVVLDKDTTAKKTHFEWLKNSFDKHVEKSISSISNNDDEDMINDMSVGNTHIYCGWFTKEFTENELMVRNEVKIVEKVERNMRINSVIPRDIQKAPPENLDRIDQAKFPLDGTYSFPNSAGQGVNVFVVDTGILLEHSEFEGRAKNGVTCTGCSNTDDNGHGTHVAGTIAGKNFGVAKKANLIAVKVFDATGSGSNLNVVSGLMFVLSEHKNSTNKNSVVNMSLGGVLSQVVNNAVKELTAGGVHVVVAAGNDFSDACETSPASEPSAITVGATNKDSDDIADFSNFGKCVDILAPGVDIKSASIPEIKDTETLSGTSQATPHVTGTIALLIAKSGNQSPEAMAKILIDLSTKDVVIFSKKANNTANNFVRVPSP